MLPSLACLSLKAHPIDVGYDEADPPEVALDHLLKSVVVEPVNDPWESDKGFRMRTKNPEPGHEVGEHKLFGMPEFAPGTDHGGHFWLECVECIVVPEDDAKKGKVKSQITLALYSKGSDDSYDRQDFNAMLNSLAPGFEAPLLFKVDIKGTPKCTNNPFGTRQRMLKQVAFAARKLVTNAVMYSTEAESD